MILGFLGGAAAIVGLSGLSQTALTVAILVVGGVLTWFGFSWAGRKPTLLAFAGLATMWIGYAVAGGLYYGNWIGAEFSGEVILEDPQYLVPVGLLYIAGSALFAWAAWESFGKAFKQRDSISSKGAMGVGVAGASVCGGCGVTGLVGGFGVLATGTAALKRPSAYVAMLVAALLVLAYTLYKRQWKQSAVVALGGFIAIPVPRFLVTFPEGNVAAVGSMLITYVGLSIVFFGLVWAYYPQMRLLPEEWSLSIASRDTT